MGKHLTQPVIDRLRRLCEVHSMTTAAEIVGVERRSVSDAKRRGWKAVRVDRRPRPTDFAIISRTMRKKDLMARYKAGDRQVQRWSEEIARESLRRGNGVPAQLIPADLAAVVAAKGPYGAATHYGVHYNTVKRWRKAAGLPLSWSRRPKAEREAAVRIGWADTYFQAAAR